MRERKRERTDVSSLSLQKPEKGHYMNVKRFLKITKLVVGCSLILFASGCKSTATQKKTPFSIDEKSYFHWIGGEEGKRGTTITIKGYTQSLNLSFSKIYFQNREFDVVPQFNGKDFILSATILEPYKPDLVMSGDPSDEYGNKPPSSSKSKIPFELENDEAVLMYSVNGKESFYKVSGVIKLDTVNRP